MIGEKVGEASGQVTTQRVLANPGGGPKMETSFRSTGTLLGLNMAEPVGGTAGSGPLAGQTYVITGTLPSLSRDAATNLIESAGGQVSDSVSKRTTALVAGEDAGSKLVKAQTLGVPVIDESELLRRATSKA